MRRIKELEKILTNAQDEYYNGTPIMSDDEYDALADELADLDPKNKVLANVGAKVSDDSRLRKVTHKIPMGSQKKVNTEAEFIKWAKKINATTYTIQEKLDGLSVELVYKKGKLIQAITRGNGVEGEDITHNVIHMGNVSQTLPKFTGSIRGEIILPKSKFEKHFESEGYVNPRNAASGISRRKTINKKALQHIKIIAFNCISDTINFKKEHHKIRFLENLGVECVFTKVVDLDNAIKGYNHYQNKKRNTLDHEIDGMVYKVDNIEKQEALGEIAGRPRAQIAWKFSPEMRKTILESISWEVGLTGRITPVAHLKPVKVGGVTIEKASLHNVSYVKNLGLWIGAEVLVSRRNDVIPAVERAIKPGANPLPAYPTHCPFCSGNTGFDGEYLMCLEDSCPAKSIGDIKKWIRVLEIDQVGPAFVTAAMHAGLIKDPADLYVLSADIIAALPGYQQKSAKTIVQNINKTRELPLKKFMAALNIPGIGTSTFEALEAAGYDSIDKLLNAAHYDLQQIPGIGLRTARGLINGIKLKKTLIDKLLAHGVTIKKKVVGKLTGKSFCFTGQISIKRGDAMKLVESLGGEVKTSVSKGLTYLIQANKTSQSGKSQKAQKYGTEILGEAEFFDLVDFSLKKLRRILNK